MIRPRGPRLRPSAADHGLASVPPVVLIVVLLAAMLGACSSADNPQAWSEAEKAVMSLGVPDGYVDGGLARRGDEACGASPSCEKPWVTRTFRPTTPTSERAACETFRDAVQTWASTGLQQPGWERSAGLGLDCNLAATLNGLALSGDVSTVGEIRVRASLRR